MNTQELEMFKKKLIAEKKQLENDLSKVGQRDPSAAQGWEATAGDLDIDTADENEVADKFEEAEGNNGIVDKLDDQLEEVNAALERIEKGTFGLCEVCGQPIEMERLAANPSARVSIKHGHPVTTR